MNEQEWLASTDPTTMLEFIVEQSQSDVPRENRVRLVTVSDRKLRLFAASCCRQMWHLLTDDAPCPGCFDCKPLYMDGPLYVDSHRICSGTGRINRYRRAVEVAERFADDESECDAEYMRLAYGNPPPFYYSDSWIAEKFEQELARLTCGPISAMSANSGLPRWFSVSNKHAAAQADLLRHIVGLPFRPWVRVDKPCPQCGQGWIGSKPDANGSSVCVCGHDFYSLPLACLTPTVLDLARLLYDGEQDAAGPLHDALEQEGAPSELVWHFSPMNEDHLDRDVSKPGTGIREWIQWHPKGCWALDAILNLG